MITIISPGPLSTVQDLGRPGYARLGVGRSGAADAAALRFANRLVGNVSSSAAIEMTLGRLRARFTEDALIALTGARCGLTIDGVPAQMAAPIQVRAGQELRVAAPAVGLRSYLAVRGGVDVPLVLGSRSTDTLSGIGPARLAGGAVLQVGRMPQVAEPTEPAPEPAPEPVADPVLDVVLGPRDDWFAAAALGTLFRTAFTVSTAADRVGVRLTGPELERHRGQELLPEPMVVGSLQVPPDGQPIIFLADHPVTGGYPVIAVLTDRALSGAAQLRPGRTVRFRPA